VNDRSSLNTKLEVERRKLHNLTNHHDLTHPLVIRQSQLLDRLINEYNNKSKKKRFKESIYLNVDNELYEKVLF
jgi:hypothetical protein